MKIPGDISVAVRKCFDGGIFSRAADTVRQPKFRLGIAAVDSMMKLIHGEPVRHKD